MKSLSIIIVNWNGLSVIIDCIGSILKNVKDIDYEIIVVDNNSSDGSPEAIEKNFSDVKLIKLGENTGFAKANNVGIKKSSAKYVMLLNPDTIIISDAVQKMVEYLDINKKTGIIGPKLVYENGNFQVSCGRIPNFLTEFSDHFLLSKIFFLNKIFHDRFIETQYSDIIKVGWLSGACFITRSVIFENIGLLDEQFFMYMEDVDFCQRIKEAGWDVVYYPDVTIKHLCGYGIKKADFQIIVKNTNSLFKYYKKQFNKVLCFILKISFFIGTILRILLFFHVYIFTLKCEFKFKLINNIKILKSSVKIIFSRI